MAFCHSESKCFKTQRQRLWLSRQGICRAVQQGGSAESPPCRSDTSPREAPGLGEAPEIGISGSAPAGTLVSDALVATQQRDLQLAQMGAMTSGTQKKRSEFNIVQHSAPGAPDPSHLWRLQPRLAPFHQLPCPRDADSVWEAFHVDWLPGVCRSHQHPI